MPFQISKEKKALLAWGAKPGRNNSFSEEYFWKEENLKELHDTGPVGQLIVEALAEMHSKVRGMWVPYLEVNCGDENDVTVARFVDNYRKHALPTFPDQSIDCAISLSYFDYQPVEQFEDNLQTVDPLALLSGVSNHVAMEGTAVMFFYLAAAFIELLMAKKWKVAHVVMSLHVLEVTFRLGVRQLTFKYDCRVFDQNRRAAEWVRANKSTDSKDSP